MPCPSDHNALAAFAAKNKCGFDDGHDREPFGMSQHISWNSSFWHLAEIANDRSTVVNRPLFGAAGRDD